MRRISKPIAPNAVVALAVVSVIAVSAGLGDARAEDCLAAPNAASPLGQHWYYRIDRVKQRKCWYLHAPQHAAHRRAAVVANAEIEHPAPAAPVPFAAAPMPFAAAPRPAAPVPMPALDQPMAEAAPVTGDTLSQQHVAALAVKTIVVRPPDATAEARSRHRASEASIQQASAQVYRATPENKSESPIFFVLVFGLGVVTFLMAIIIKCVAPQASWPSWPARSGADFAWPRHRRNYSERVRLNAGYESFSGQ